MRHVIFSLLVCMIASLPCDAQTTDSLELRIRQHVYTLAADSMEGRNTGTEGERKAIRYITGHYKQLGLQPGGTNGFEQEFTFSNGMRYAGENVVLIDGNVLKPDVDFFPLPGSGSATLTKEKTFWAADGIAAPEIKTNDYKGAKPGVFVIRLGGDDAANPHSTLHQYADINYKIKTAIDHGAKAIVFINTDSARADDLRKDFSRNVATRPVPVVFIRSHASYKFNFSDGKPHVVSMNVNVEPVKRKGTNVVAMIDNPGTESVVVIGGHFDHLGFGHDDNSLSKNRADTIHNGADDNASGTAGVLELARMLKNSTLRSNDYLFVNFSGEELGLLGSKYYVEHATVDTSKINYMINMDMIGRYRAEKGIEISGIGTSPEAFAFIEKLDYNHIKIKAGQQGTGPTDHTSFYYANIPVLNFFTGTHEDYHKPSDDADKVNFNDAAKIVRLMYNIIDSLDEKGTLPFSKTQEQNLSDVPAFKVRLGIIPDYMFEGPGVRIDGVSDAMPAQKAGLQKGDIILSLDAYRTTDVMSYMKALSLFKKGDKAKATYKRGETESTAVIEF